MSDAAYKKSRVMGLLGSPKVTVYCLACLFVLTLVGTLYQVEHGLFEAQQVYYNSWFVMIEGLVPFPGAQLVLTVLFINLLGYFLLVMSMEVGKIGMLLVHTGLLFLLVGGFINHYHAEESFLTLAEGAGSNVSSSYHDWELAVWKETGDRRLVTAADMDRPRPGDTVSFGELGFDLRIKTYHKNTRAFQAPDDHVEFLNASRISRLEGLEKSTSPEENIPGGVFELAAPGYHGPALLLFGGDPNPVTVTVGGQTYFLSLRRARSPLPVLVRLVDFRREMYPNSETPKSFSSVVEIETGTERAREVLISMNKPLRYRGYTLYQASYSEARGAQASTFAVVKNYGRLVPYIATGVTVIGMVFHFMIMLVKRARSGVLRVS